MVELARNQTERPHVTGSGEAREFLVFLLAGEPYGVELARVREILTPPKITPVPRASNQVIGICSVRGLLVTILDLRRRLRLPASPISRSSRVLLSQGASGEVFGLLVDGVRHVIRLGERDIEMAATLLGNDVSESVMGIGRARGEMLVLLNLGVIVG